MGNSFSRFSNSSGNKITPLEEQGIGHILLDKIQQYRSDTSGNRNEPYVYYRLPRIGCPEE
jgi:hypothetical protein